mgnify:CR=1 FL=1
MINVTNVEIKFPATVMICGIACKIPFAIFVIICTPVSNKLKKNNAAEVQLREIMIEGLLSIQAGENPRVIEEKLKSFLAPKDRKSSETEGGEENG